MLAKIFHKIWHFEKKMQKKRCKNVILFWTGSALPLHQIKEELWNLWDMLFGVLESLQYFFPLHVQNEAKNHTFTLFSWSRVNFSQRNFLNMFIQIYLGQTWKFTECLYVRDFEIRNTVAQIFDITMPTINTKWYFLV